jgi:hypothetical protein
MVKRSARLQGTVVAFDYMQWLQSERGVNVRTLGLVIRSIMSAAKFLYHDDSKARPQPQAVKQHFEDAGHGHQSLDVMYTHSRCVIVAAAGAAW